MVAGSLEGFLLERGLVTSAELGKARQMSDETGERLITTVRRLGLLAGPDLARAVAAYYKLPTVREGDWPKRAPFCWSGRERSLRACCPTSSPTENLHPN